MELLPQQLFWYSKAGEFEKAEHLNLFDCIECGACSYVCPSSIPLVQYYRAAKGEIRVQQAEQIKADRARERFEARQARLEREQQEKELRRQERAQAAAEAQARKKAEAEQAVAQGDAKDERAAKAALVQEALARKKAKTEAPPAADVPDRAELEKQLAQARSKLETMQSMLEDAKAQQADNVDKLERAVAKNHERVKRAEQALADGKAVDGLETIAEQLDAMASLSLEFHVRGLVETLSLGPLLEDVTATMTDLYVAGETGMIMPMLREAAPEGHERDAQGYADFEERIVLARNRIMAERAEPFLDEGHAFIAVGALHLPGDEGVIELLRDAGYSVERAD